MNINKKTKTFLILTMLTVIFGTYMIINSNTKYQEKVKFEKTNATINVGKFYNINEKYDGLDILVKNHSKEKITISCNDVYISNIFDKEYQNISFKEEMENDSEKFTIIIPRMIEGNPINIDAHVSIQSNTKETKILHSEFKGE